MRLIIRFINYLSIANQVISDYLTQPRTNKKCLTIFLFKWVNKRIISVLGNHFKRSFSISKLGVF